MGSPPTLPGHFMQTSAIFLNTDLFSLTWIVKSSFNYYYNEDWFDMNVDL